MRVTFHGTRGSVATPGAETLKYGGDTACVAVSGHDPSHLIILDAGSGIRSLGMQIGDEVERIDLLLSHLHLDHIIGLGFFKPLFRPDLVITIWAPPSTVPLLERLGRYLSPPLFPVRLRDVDCELHLRDSGLDPVVLGEFTISAEPIIHPDFAVGYRIEAAGGSMAYLPDHEPALSPSYPTLPEWTSGVAIARGVDLLIHDGQYAPDEYDDHVGWGHASTTHAVDFARIAGVRSMALFHFDPSHDDAAIERLATLAQATATETEIFAARQGTTVTIGS